MFWCYKDGSIKIKDVYATMEEAERDLFYYIEVFYDRKRLHGSLGYMSPVTYRMKKTGLSTGKKKEYKHMAEKPITQ